MDSMPGERLGGTGLARAGLRRSLLALLALLGCWALIGSTFGAETLVEARYAEPVERYGHFALGRPHEYARLTATTSAGRKFELRLPEDEVFEDLAPRLVRLAPGAPQEILAIISRRASGARLALIHLAGDRLVISAQSAAIGIPNRWLNPVGVADLDGDGRVEIAAVITPHIGGTLKVYRKTGANLVEIAAVDGFSNHQYGSPELALSLPVSVGGRMRLLVPDMTRQHLRVIGLERDRLVEVGRCDLAAPVVGTLRSLASGEIEAGTLAGPQRVVLTACLR